MPIKYTRVGWQDAPSMETPIDAANLNHMDNGILALSEEMDTELPLIREQINDVSADIESQIDEKIPPEVSSWLNEHVTPSGSAVVVDDTLTIQGAAADAKKTGDEISSLKEDLEKYVDIFTGNVDESVRAWLEEHPEATTTVQDGSLTEEKFSDELKLKTVKDYVTPEMFGAKGDGVTDDTSAFLDAINSGKPVVLSTRTYKLNQNSRIHIANINNIRIVGNDAKLLALLQFDNCSYVSIRDVAIDGNQGWYLRPYSDESSFAQYESDRANTDFALVFNGCSNVTLDNISVSHSRQGFSITSTNNVKIINCISNYTMADGFYICDGSENVEVNNCFVYNANDDALACFGNENGQPKNISFTNCFVENCFGALICAYGCIDVFADNCIGKQLYFIPFKLGANGASYKGENQTVINCSVDYDGISRIDGTEAAFVNAGSSSGIVIANCKINKPISTPYRLAIRDAKYLHVDNCVFENFTLLLMGGVESFEITNSKIVGGQYLQIQGCSNGFISQNIIGVSTSDRAVYLNNNNNNLTFRNNDYITSDKDIVFWKDNTISDNISIDTSNVANAKASYVTNVSVDGVAFVSEADFNFMRAALKNGQLYYFDNTLSVKQ